MSPATRQQALEKLAKLNVKIGYPDKWRDYSTLRVDPGDLLGNSERAGVFECESQTGAPRSAGGSQRVGNVAADGERLLRDVH